VRIPFDVWRRELPRAFEAAVREGQVDAVMTAQVAYPFTDRADLRTRGNRPRSSRYFITEVLRESWRSTGSLFQTR
jgi:beta-glucosidase-like glycosyl hydrolase